MASMARIVIIVIIISLLVAAIILAVKYLRYRHHINDVLNGVEDKSKRISSPESTLIGVLIVLLILWNGINLTQVSMLQSSINNLNDRISGMERDLSIYSEDIGAKLKNINSPVLSETMYVNGFDTDKHLVKLSWEITLNRYSDDTKATLIYDSFEVPLTTSENGVFTGALDYDIFDVCDGVSQIIVERNGEKEIAPLDEGYYGPFFNDLLPEVYASKVPWDASWKNGKLKIDDEMWFLLKANKDGIDYTGATLIATINGSEVDRYEIGEVSESQRYTININKEYDLAEGDIFAYYIETRNTAGYTERTNAWYYLGTKNGNEADWYSDLPTIQVFDDNGNLMFSE